MIREQFISILWGAVALTILGILVFSFYLWSASSKLPEEDVVTYTYHYMLYIDDRKPLRFESLHYKYDDHIILIDSTGTHRTFEGGWTIEKVQEEQR